MGFSAKQLHALRRDVKRENIRSRVSNGRELSYIEGGYAIAEANRIFGFDGWDRETVDSRCVITRENRGNFLVVYTSKGPNYRARGRREDRARRPWMRRGEGDVGRRDPRSCPQDLRNRCHEARACDLWETIRACPLLRKIHARGFQRNANNRTRADAVRRTSADRRTGAGEQLTVMALTSRC